MLSNELDWPNGLPNILKGLLVAGWPRVGLFTIDCMAPHPSLLVVYSLPTGSKRGASLSLPGMAALPFYRGAFCPLE